MIFYKIFKYYFKRFIRHLYWVFCLVKSDINKSVTFSFPLIVEIKGKLSIGSKTAIGAKVKLAAGSNSRLNIGNHSRLDEKSLIVVSENQSFTTGCRFSLGSNSRLYVNEKWKIGENVNISTNCQIFSREAGYYGRLTLGNGVQIGDNAIIDLSDNLILGEDVGIGPNCTIYTHGHDYSNGDEAPWKGNVYCKPVEIKRLSYLGVNVTIMPGVTIGERCVVAAGSVVTKNLEDNGLYGGIPAKLLKRI